MTNLFTKFVGSITAVALLAAIFTGIIPQEVAAADTSDIVVTNTFTFTDSEVSSWTTDRQNPGSWASAAGSNNRENVLVVGINSLATSEKFSRTEGKKKVLDNVSSIEADLFLDPTWQTTAVRAGIWATSNGVAPEWGIIEFTTANGYDHNDPVTNSLKKNVTFRTWDSSSGTWTSVADVAPAFGTWVKFRVELSDGSWHYFINGTPVGSVAVDAADSVAIKEIILNHYNYSAEAPENVEVGFGQGAYTAEWHDLNTVSYADTLSGAIAAASPGARLVVPAGTYTGGLTIDKRMTLQGTDGATIEGQVTVNSADVTINGFTITNPTGSKGVLINGVGNVHVTGNRFVAIGSDTGVNENTHAVWFQDGSSNVDGITVSGNAFTTIGHAAGRSAVAVGIGDSTGSTDITNVSISNNTVSGVRSSRGAYGVLVNHASGIGGDIGTTKNLDVKGNTISDLEGAWTHAIGLEGTTPNAEVTDNTISNLRVLAGIDNAAVFFEKNTEASSIKVNKNSFDLGSAMGVAMHPAFVGSYTIDATRNYWGTSNPETSVFATSGSTINVAPWLGNADGDTVVAEAESGVATTTTSGSGVQVSVAVESGTVITGDEDWNGDVDSALEVDVVDVLDLDSIEVDGYEDIVPIAAIAIGSDDNSLTLSKAARISFAGQAGKYVGWTTERDGDDFTQITATCVADDQAAVDAQLGEGADCAMNVGNDLVVWTKHFTTFVAYTADVEENNGGGSGRSGSSRRTVNTNSNVNANASVTGQVNSVTPGQGQVLGASTYNFTVDLWYGKTGADVNALQQMLIDAGLLAIPAPTGWFGPMTQAALKQWQATHGVPSTGYFGPLTRAAIAATMTAPTTSTTTPAN